MTFSERARSFWGCVSICFNQAVHFGAAPYPLSFSETCYMRQYKKRYRYALVVVDSIFFFFGEDDHCKQAWIKGMAARRLYV